MRLQLYSSWVFRRARTRRSDYASAHNHVSWQDENFRKVVLNAILWTANVEVPKEGCPSPVVNDSRIKENLDDKRNKR